VHAPAMQAALQRETWDIVISDYEMPNFGGFEALQLLKASGMTCPSFWFQRWSATNGRGGHESRRA